MNVIELMQHKSDDEPRFVTIYPNREDPIKPETYSDLSSTISRLHSTLEIDDKTYLFSKGVHGEPNIALSQTIHGNLDLMHISLLFEDRTIHVGFRNDAGTVANPDQPAAHLYAISRKKSEVPTYQEQMHNVPESAAQSLLEIIKEREADGQFERKASKPRRMILFSAAA